VVDLVRGRKAGKELAGAASYPEAAVYFQQDILSLKRLRKYTSAQNMQARVKKR